MIALIFQIYVLLMKQNFNDITDNKLFLLQFISNEIPFAYCILYSHTPVNIRAIDAILYECF